MTSIGSFGTPRPPVDLSFDYFGQEIHVNPDLSDLVLSDFGEQAMQVALTNDGLAAMGIVKSMLRDIIVEEDFDQFWSLARDNRQNAADLEEMGASIMEALSGRPTQRLSDSSPGQPTTAPSSMDASSLAVKRQFEGRGRGDLALIVKLADEDISA